MRHVVILGGGTAGTMMANKLVRQLDAAQWTITVIDRDDAHVYQPGLLFVPFGSYRADDLVRPRRRLLDPPVVLRLGELDRVDPEAREVWLTDGAVLRYDLLIIATGTVIRPDLTEGLTGPGWRSSIFDFYTMEGARALAPALDRLNRGRLVININDMPIKCPVAPLEFAFLADAYLHGRGVRDQVEIVYTTPLEGAFTKPRASAALGDMLARKNIRVVPEFNIASVDGEGREIRSFGGATERYDLLVTIPTHAGAEVISRSGLGDDAGFVPTDKHTLQSRDWPDIFVIGDATNLPSSKAGSVAHFQAEVLTENVLRYLEGRPLSPGFDGHANCFIETGFDKALLIDFNYTTEPLPGRYPLPGVGPFTLLEESATNHWGKLAFRWIYWNLLVKGEELPLDARMLMAGKWS